MIIGKEVVYLEGVLAQVRVSVLGSNPIGSALLESRCGERVDVEQSAPLWADHVLGNHVVRERPPCDRVIDYNNLAEELVGRVEQLAEVAVPHGESGHHTSRTSLVAACNPLLCPEKKQLFSIGVELVRDEDWPTQVVAILVKPEAGRGVCLGQIGAVIASPRVGVERRVAEVFNQIAVKTPSAALGDEPYLTCRTSPIFCRIVSGQYLDFLNSVHVLGAEYRA